MTYLGRDGNQWPRSPDGPTARRLRRRVRASRDLQNATVSKTRYGPSSMLMKMTRGAGRLPYYMSGYNSVLLEGQMKPWAEGQPEADVESLGPGSY
jgi:hypothetical protein